MFGLLTKVFVVLNYRNELSRLYAKRLPGGDGVACTTEAASFTLLVSVVASLQIFEKSIQAVDSSVV